VFGNEGNGTIVFNGTFSSITWTNPTYENWYDVTVGAANGVPEPPATSLVGIGATAVLLLGWSKCRIRAGYIDESRK
jgi:hypothetical protein